MHLTFNQSRNLSTILNEFRTEYKFSYSFKLEDGKFFITAANPIGFKKEYEIDLDMYCDEDTVRLFKNSMIDDVAKFMDPNAVIEGSHHYYQTRLVYKGTKLYISIETFLVSAMDTDLLKVWDYILSKGYIVTELDPYHLIKFSPIVGSIKYELSFRDGYRLWAGYPKKNLGEFDSYEKAIDSLGTFLPGFA